MRKRAGLALAAVCFLAGLTLFSYPLAQKAGFRRENEEKIRRFQEEASRSAEAGEARREEEAEEAETGEAPETSGEQTAAPEGLPQLEESSALRLRAEMEEYNRRIYEEEQSSLRDAWSYRQNSLDEGFQAAGIRDDMAGYLEIPAMEVRLPLYMGATQEHMRQGAAILGETSLPIGGESTNCVIAAHRGTARGDAMFRDIEVLKPGDQVLVTNLWETLEYRVVKAIVIEPEDIQAVKILEGDDLVTLVTCHPYGENAQRYLVYCRRAGQPVPEESRDAEAEAPSGETERPGKDEGIPYEGISYESSQEEIRREDSLELAGQAALGALLLLTALLLLLKALRRRRRGGKKSQL